MNLIGARRFTAACANRLVIVALLFGLGGRASMRAAACDTGLSSHDRLARFKQLDSAAELAVQQKRPAEAVALYSEAVCLVPDSARAYYGLGMAQAAAGDYPHARDSFRTSDRLQSTTGMPLVMQVRVNFSLHDVEALKANLREAAQRFPNDAQLHTMLARFLAERDLFVLAVAEAMRAQQAGSDPNAQIQLAALESTVGAYQDSIQNALAVEQTSELPAEIRGAAAGIAGLGYESVHEKDQAIRYLKESIELDPAQANSSLALADLFEQLQQYAEAVNLLLQARSRNPDSQAILLPLGTNLIRAERYEEGIAVIHELLQRHPDMAEAYMALADAARKTGNTQGEIDALRNLKNYRPDYPMIHVLLARALVSQQPPDYPKILAELSQATAVSPNDPDVFFLRGKTYMALGRYREALPALERAIALRPLEPSPYYQLARAYQKLGKTELARAQFERVKYLESAEVK